MIPAELEKNASSAPSGKSFFLFRSKKLPDEVKRKASAALLERPRKSINEHESFSKIWIGETLSLDVAGYEHFRIRSFNGRPVEFPNGQTLVECEAYYRLDQETIIERARANDRYDYEKKEVDSRYLKSLQIEKTIVGLVNVPISEWSDVYFYSRTKRDPDKPGMPMLRGKFFVFWAKKESSRVLWTKQAINSVLWKNPIG